jgi:hypothetical protein
MFPMLTLAVSIALGQTQRPEAETFFELKIRPVLAGTCFKCHGGKKVSHGLRVDSREALLKGGESGPAILPGKPDKSLLIQALKYSHEDIKMPPDKRLPESVVADFVTWVKQGAPWPRTQAGGTAFKARQHWAFRPVRKVTVAADPSGWADGPIDRFIEGELRRHKLKPAGPADQRVLLRRVYFDLVGLPPTPEEVDAFLADRSPAAYARVVDRLLASPRYGERWGRHFLDVVRYADTAGDNADYPIPEVRLYRDYIIHAFNADKPYDQFVREQLAGDILARQGPREKYAEQVVATGFLALSRRYATAPYELWSLTLEDAIDTTGRAFLGLTLRCARCHDHKFDPVTREDYYGLYGIFASTQFPWAGAEEFASMARPREHFVPLVPPREADKRLATYRQEIRRLEAEIKRQEKSGPPAKVNQLRTQLRNLLRPGLPPDLPGAYAVQEGKPVDMYIHLRGDADQRGPVVPRGVPRFLAGSEPLKIPRGSSGRLQLAQWLTRPDHPLTARVMVNRLWQHHFGRGLVTTPSNFGLRGETPTHPELLDWLAARFVAGGWSVKAIHREILLSKTYQLASAQDADNAARDPANRWYWRYDRRRLDAEAIRDALLMVSGKLDERRPGPHPFPPIRNWGWTQHNPFKAVYPSNHRSVYLMTQRIQRHPFLALFDGPDTNTTTARRGTSTVPLQALFLMNNPFLTEQAEGFARRLIGASGDSRQRVDLAHRLAWSRPARLVEKEKGVRYVEEYRRQLGQLGVVGERQEVEAWTSYARVMLSANEFVYLD